MDNTDNKRRPVLFKRLTNSLTGEQVIRVRPKPEPKQKRKVIATGKGEKTVGKILLARLAPLRRAMVWGLLRKGINVTGLDLKRVVILYYNHFSPNKPLDVETFCDNPVFKLKPSDTISGDVTAARNQTSMVAVNDVVLEVIRLFAAARKRYETLYQLGFDPRLDMSEVEYQQARAAIRAVRQLEAESSYDHYLKADQLLTMVKWVAVVWLVLYLIKKL